jgi:mono/diheme cytochrome c family protein
MSSMGRILALAIVLTLAAAGAHGQDRSPAPAAPPGADPLIGQQIFSNLCGFCHQDGGRVAGRGPKLAGTDRPDDYILNRIRTGKEGAMPAYGRAFTDAQLRSLIAYIRSLKDDNQ